MSADREIFSCRPDRPLLFLVGADEGTVTKAQALIEALGVDAVVFPVVDGFTVEIRHGDEIWASGYIATTGG